MNRIINSLAEAEFNKKLNAVEVNFLGTGLPPLYHETMDIAMNISLIYHTNRWLLQKNDYEDISPDAFLNFIQIWSKKAYQLFLQHDVTLKCQVALVTTVDCCLYLKSEYPALNNEDVHDTSLALHLFTSINEAQAYLSHGNAPQFLT